jgi:hypothetical protein
VKHAEAMRGGSRTSGSRSQDGAATVEFVLVAVFCLVPLTYVLLTALSVQSTAFAVVEAARSGAQAFVSAPSGSLAGSRADRAVDLALADQGLSAEPRDVQITCSRSPCLTPGGTVRVRVSATVQLGWLPGWLGAGGAGIPVQAVHEKTVDPYLPART